MNCMMEDNKSKNYNSILVSLVSELLFENNNVEIGREDCYTYIVNDLKIKLQKDLFINIVEKSKNFIHTPNQNDVGIKLTDKRFSEINDNVVNHSIGKYIDDFLEKEKMPKELKTSIESLLFQAIYENINSFTIQNIDSIIPQDAKKNYSNIEINAFNNFLNDSSIEKNTVLFNTFLKAIEFAIITSGKGVNEFTKGVFEGKEYLLDANIIFRLIGVGGNERKKSLINLIEQCNHQGIKFFYTNESYQEFKRKVDASIRDIKRATESKSITLLEEMLLENKEDFNQGFITHYAESKIAKEVRSPEQYETKVMADFRILCKKHNISTLSLNGNLKNRDIERMQNVLYKDKKDIYEYSKYTKTAAKVDATNVLSVKYLRGQNDYNYSDIKSFYLTTDRTLNGILATKAGDKIAETILPSQLFILHNSLSDNGDEKDYDAFTKFLKRRTTEFKYTGKQVLSYIDDIRNHTVEPEHIKEILKAYSDKKYDTSLLDIDVEPEYVSIKDFAETFVDNKLKKAEVGDDKYKKVLENAEKEFPKYLKSAKTTVRIIDVIITILLIPITVLIVKKFVDDIIIVAIAVLIAEAIKFILSSRLSYYSDWTKSIFMNKVQKSSYHKTFKSVDRTYIKKAKEFIDGEIKIWK
ncbi:hypothetical protein [Tenacibaculum finnmarkense]|uniref:hypothetical protein n=1 Tax=Tenacibaculum finnmarkense TaxID=2781243 RepID=UPI001EFAE212|nr:hypothetical protein [Tenacibaculum finnmarkense]MCG8796661.1 hypothetical protein [Tenacibaculum finnmarkense]